MKKTRIILFLSSLILPIGASLPQVRDEIKAPVKEVNSPSYNSVCINGNLQYKEHRNFLPKGFWGNYPDLGIAEIGGKAGDVNGYDVPELSWAKTGRFSACLLLDRPLDSFPESSYLTSFGYELSVYIPGEGDEVSTVLVEGTSFADAFAKTTDDSFTLQYPGTILPATNPVATYWNDNEGESYAFLLTFYMGEGYKFNYLKVYYGDTPVRILNASISDSIGLPTDYGKDEYTENDCSFTSHMVRVGTHPVYNLKSQYGSVYSQDYLLSCFMAKDDFDGEESHITIIEDPENYFSYGAEAAIGSKFTIYLYAYDKAENSSYVTINLTIADTRPPRIEKRSEEIITSYKTDFSSDEFLNESFSISDNYFGKLTSEVTLENGEAIPSQTVGDFDSLLTVTDYFGNTSKEAFKLKIIDDIAPEITAEQDELIISPTKVISEAYIENLFSAYDEIDGDIEVTLETNEYTGHEDEIGTYKVVATAVDEAGNTASKTLNIIVQDDEGPVFYAKESFLTVTEGDVPSLDEVTESLIRQSVIPNRNYITKEIVEGLPLDNDLPVGLHNLTLHLIADDESEEFVQLSVKVVEAKDIGVQDASLSIWDRIVQFFITLWEKIVAFFTGQEV